MISHEALQRRKWGEYPNLSAVLGDKPPTDLDGRSSIDPSFIEHVGNTMGVLNLLDKHIDEVAASARSGKRREIRGEVDKLADEIRALASRLEDQSYRAKILLESLE